MDSPERYFRNNELTDVVAEFKNEFEEKYVIYRLKGINDVLFITGDELEWETGWIYEQAGSRAIKVFVLSSTENDKATLAITDSKRR